MTGLYVGVDPKGSHRVYRSKNGLGQEWVGPPFAEPRDAIAYAAKLRGSRMPSDAALSGPLDATASHVGQPSEPFSGSPEGASAPPDAAGHPLPPPAADAHSVAGGR